MNTIKIMIAEDHALTRIGLKYSLEKYEDLDILEDAQDGRDALNKCQLNSPDLILMDLGMPEMDGIEATRQIKQINSSVKIIMLTSHTEEEDVLAAFVAGADAYCIKDIQPERLYMAIKSVSEGVVWIDPEIAKVVLSHMPAKSAAKQELKVADADLTPREHDVLELIVEGCSNADIADRLCISMHTVKTHISNILSKLEVNDRTQAAMKAVKGEI